MKTVRKIVMHFHETQSDNAVEPGVGEFLNGGFKAFFLDELVDDPVTEVIDPKRIGLLDSLDDCPFTDLISS